MLNRQILAERESIFRLLPQTTSENVAKDWKNYTIDPCSRWVSLSSCLSVTLSIPIMIKWFCITVLKRSFHKLVVIVKVLQKIILV